MTIRNRFFLFLLLIAIAGLALPVAFAQAKLNPQTDTVRVIIQLKDAPLAQYRDTLPTLKGVTSARTADGHLKVKDPASRAYVDYLRQQQDSFVPLLRTAVPDARLQQRYQIGFNGMAAVVRRAALDQIRSLPGVKAVTETYKLEPELDESKNLTGLATLWAAPGVGTPAGSGRRFALIDSGVNAAHPFFNDTGFTAPSGYPKSYRYDSGNITNLSLATYTSDKVIVANVYVQPGDTSTDFGFPYGAGSDHGDHVAGIAAGTEGLYTYTAGGSPFPLTFSGQAPGAYIMSYRVTGDTAEYLAAIEDVIADQADAVNLSLGHSRWITTDADHDPLKEALEAAVDAGVVVCGSAGNAGAAGDNTITGAWKYSPKVITVAANTHARIFSNPLSTDDAGGPQDRVAVPGASPAPAISTPITGQVGFANNNLPAGEIMGDACGAVTGMTGKICMAVRGSCTFAVKQANCFAAGATAFVVYQNSGNNAGLPPSAMGALIATIPGVMISRADATALHTFLTTGTPTPDTVTIDTIQRLTSGWPDLVTGFSSRGPTGIGTIKPDISAPGDSILSSVVDTNTGAVVPGFEFEQFSGTSMSTPHISGIAVVTKAAHPTWTPAQIKSAIMNTAETDMYLDVNNTQYALAKHRGAGRVQASKLVDPYLTFAPPSVSFGVIDTGDSGSMQVQATDVRTSGSPVSWTVGVTGVVTNGSVLVTTSSGAFSTGPGQQATFNVNLATTGAPAGDFEGFITITDGGSQNFTIPYWVRLLDPTAHKDVLLVDWDLSPTAGHGNYVSVFQTALTNLGITFDTFSAGSSTSTTLPSANPAPTLAQLQNYGTIIFFTGDNFRAYSSRHTSGSFPIEAYLTNGGRMIITGQDTASFVSYSQNQGTDFTFTSMAGWIDGDFDFYPVVDGTELLNTQIELFGQTVDVGVNLGGSGSENQFFPDSGRAVRAEDRDDPNIALYNAQNIGPHARVLGTYIATDFQGSPVALTQTAAATGVVPDATLENAEALVNWRAAFLHVGIEGVNANLGDLSIDDVVEGLYNFVNDEVSATLSAVGAGANRAFTCSGVSDAGSTFVSYRWDFGDGSPWEGTFGNTNSHTYSSNGSYTARCEATTELTRTAVGSKNIIVFCPAITIAPATLTNGTVGTAYSDTVTATGGTAPYSYTLFDGSFPVGLSLNAGTGEISGTPTVDGPDSFMIEAVDANGCSGIQEHFLTIDCPAITVTPATLPDGETFTAYSQTVAGNGGTGPYTFAVTSGSLPNGLSLNTTTGEITGTPTAVNSFSFTITATDDYGCTGSTAYTVDITQGCLFCDDFNNQSVDWSVVKGVWTESVGGALTTTASSKNVIDATSVFGAGCQVCSIEASMETAGGVGNKLWLLGWFVDKNNTMELLLKEENDKIILKQKVAGATVAKASGPATITPNTAHIVVINFDGTDFDVTVDGNPVITDFAPVGIVPTGNIGFQAKDTTASFDYITVN